MPKANNTFQGVIGNTFRESTPSWPTPASAPPNAPNVIFIVLDDVGFSDLGCYGSEIATPHIDALAAKGLRYSNFHVTSMCSPTRACLLTGRNAHAVGVGIIAEWSSGYPGYRGKLDKSAATIPEILHEHAYCSYAVGKWHLTNIADYGSAGPHDDWPIGRGFDRWYGFHGALTDQWNPELCQDNRPIRLEKPKDYHLSTDLVSHTITDIKDHLTSAGERPFFQYLAFGACHWPHHVPKEYIDKYKGRYAQGWDKIRAARQQKQFDLGIIPKGTELAPLNPGVQAWSDLEPGVRRLAERLQETYAGFLEHTDAEIGRLLVFLETSGQIDNTLIFLLSDNGASPEGGPTGAINLRKHMVYEQEAPEVGLAHLDEIGSDKAFNHYPTGWAQVSNTPLKWYKKGNHGGGIRAPLIVSWPKGIAPSGEIRTQYHHVIDVAPTLFEIIGITAPEQLKGQPQQPIHGASMAYSFKLPNAPTPKKTQLFELLGDRAIWHEGWKAVARHPKGRDFSLDQWELYHLDADYSECRDLSATQPDKLKQMVDLWWQEAKKYQVLPLDDRDWERAAERLKSSPVTHYEFFQDMARIDRLAAPDITDRSYRVLATFDDPAATAEGVILSWGSRFGGFVLYIKDRTLHYEYVFSEATTHRAQLPMPKQGGLTQLTLSVQRSGNNAGVAHLSLGQQSARVELPRTWPTHGTTAGVNCGLDAGAPVSDAYTMPFAFSGKNLRVIMDLQINGEREQGAAYNQALKEQ